MLKWKRATERSTSTIVKWKIQNKRVDSLRLVRRAASFFVLFGRFLTCMHLSLYWWFVFLFFYYCFRLCARNGRITLPQTPIQPHLLHLIKTNYCLHTMLYISSLKKIYCLFGIYYARNVSVAFLQIKIWTDLWAHSLVFSSSNTYTQLLTFHIVSLILSRNRVTFHLWKIQKVRSTVQCMPNIRIRTR